MNNETNELTQEQIEALDYEAESQHMRFEFYRLIASMVEDILLLEEDLVRWRKALIPHLTKPNAEGL